MNSLSQLHDWRLRIADLYAAIRTMPDAKEAWQLWRATRDRLFATHAQTPLEADRLAGFAGIDLYPYDPALRFLVTLSDHVGPALVLPAGDDGTVEATPFARTVGLQQDLGGELTLYWLGGYGGGVFLPFADATSGRETYGGGRYLLDTIKSADLGLAPDGRTVLDFNFAYAPSCAYSPRYICPLAPTANRLPRAVFAGERNHTIR